MDFWTVSWVFFLLLSFFVAQLVQVKPLHIFVQVMVFAVSGRRLRDEILSEFRSAFINGDCVADNICGHLCSVREAGALHPGCFELGYAAPMLAKDPLCRDYRCLVSAHLLTQSKSPMKRMESTGLENVSRNCSMYRNCSCFSFLSFSELCVRICQREKVFQAKRSISSLPVLRRPM